MRYRVKRNCSQESTLKEYSPVIREKAAFKLARQILGGNLIRLEVNDKMIEMVARMIMTAVDMDEQRQRSEKILGDVER